MYINDLITLSMDGREDNGNKRVFIRAKDGKLYVPVFCIHFGDGMKDPQFVLEMGEQWNLLEVSNDSSMNVKRKGSVKSYAKKRYFHRS